MRARVTTEEKATRVLEAKVAELEKWRPEIEKRIADRNVDVDEKFVRQHDRLEAFKGIVKDENDIQAIHNTKADNQYDEVKGILMHNKEDRDRLSGRQERLESRITQVQEHLKEDIDVNYQKL